MGDNVLLLFYKNKPLKAAVRKKIEHIELCINANRKCEVDTIIH